MASGSRDAQASLARGRTIARALTGSWCPEPSPPTLTHETLAAVVPLLIEAGTAGLACRRLRLSVPDGTGLPRTLRDAARLEAAVTLQGDVALRRAVAALDTAGIAPLLAKGWAVGSLYPSPALRPYGDLDLYIPPAQLEAARRALLSLKLPIAVDLQPHPIELDDRPYAQLVARGILRPVGGLAVRVLGPEDHLRLLCLHLLRHEGIRPLWLCDVAAALEALPPTFDWDYLLRGRRRRARWVLCVLGLAHTLLGAALYAPAHLRPYLEPPLWVERAMLRRWGHGMRIFPHRTLLAYLRDPHGLGEAVRDRLPGPIAAAIHWGGDPDPRPRYRHQILDILWMGYWFGRLHLQPMSRDRRVSLSDARFERMRRLTI